MVKRFLSLLPSAGQDFLRKVAALALERSTRWSNHRGALVLVYHRVGDPPGDVARELVPALGTGLFEAELAHLRRRYRVVPASAILKAVDTRRRGGRFPIAITFDDDLDSHVKTAAPILRSAGLPATFFLCGASLDGPSTFWWETLQVVVDHCVATTARLPLLEPMDVDAAFAREPFAIHHVAKIVESLPPKQQKRVADELERRADPGLLPAAFGPDQVETLANSGFELGFHTRDHFLLTSLDHRELALELTAGREELERVASQRLSLLAYPHGKAGERVATAAREAGFALAFTGSREVVKPGTHPFLIGRLEPRADAPGGFALELARALHQSWRQRAVA